MELKKRIAAAVCSAALAVSVSAVNASADAEKNWVDLYASILRKEIGSPSEYPDGFDAFSVFDIDSDGTPELILSQGDYHGAGCTIYTVFGGKTVKVGEAGSYGECACIPSKKYVISSYMGMGYTTVAFCEMNGTELTQIIQFDDNSGVAEDGEEITFTIDGENVTHEEYDAKFDEMHTDSSISLGRTFPLTENSIEYAVAGVKDHRTAYRNVLTDCYVNYPYRSGNEKFMLMNITGDKSPELIVLDYGAKIYTVKDGRVSLIAEEYAPLVSTASVSQSCGYNSAKRVFVLRAVSADKSYAYSYYGTKGNISLKASFSCGKDYDGKYIYKLNGKEVKRSAYKKAMKKYSGIKFSKLKEYDITEENIKKVLG